MNKVLFAAIIALAMIGGTVAVSVIQAVPAMAGCDPRC